MFYLAALGAMWSVSPYGQHIEWQPSRLNQELHAIAGLESSWGLRQDHAPHSRGPFHTAYGPVGLKASTAHMEYMRSKSLKRVYPDLKDKDLFLKEFLANPSFYYACANRHWKWLRSHTKSTEVAVYAWRWGYGAATKAIEDDVVADVYVSRYRTLNQVMTAARIMQ